MSWEYFEMPPRGRAGMNGYRKVEAGFSYCYLDGSDHKLDWLHHILPFAGWRERRAGKEIADMLFDPKIRRYVIGGHSIGGAVICVTAQDLRGRGCEVSAFSYGGKRVPLFVDPKQVVLVVNKGDIVPSLLRWRPGYDRHTTITRDVGPLNFVEAHEPRNYYRRMIEDGLRLDATSTIPAST